MNTPAPVAQATYSYGTDFSSAFATISGQPDQTLLDMLKLFLGIDPADDTKDEELTRALNMAGDVIETYLDRIIAKREVLENFPHHFGTVVLHNLPVDTSANLTVYLNGVAQSGYSAWLARDGLAHLSRTGIRQDMPMDWRGYDQVGVTYTAGYAPIPSDLAQAIIYTAADLYNSEGSGAAPGGGSGDVKSMSIVDVGSISYDVGGSSSSGGGTFGSPGVIPSAAAQLLTRYKRMAA